MQHYFVQIHQLNLRSRKSRALWTQGSPDSLHVKIKALLHPVLYAAATMIWSIALSAMWLGSSNELHGSSWKYFVWRCNGLLKGSGHFKARSSVVKWLGLLILLIVQNTTLRFLGLLLPRAEALMGVTFCPKQSMH